MLIKKKNSVPMVQKTYGSLIKTDYNKIHMYLNHFKFTKYSKSRLNLNKHLSVKLVLLLEINGRDN